MKVVGGSVQLEVGGYSALQRALSDWKVDGKSIGGIHSWDEKTVFVIDSLTFLGEACMHETLRMSGHLGARPTQPEWGTAIDMQESVIEMLYNPAVRCNIVVTSHLRSVADETQNNQERLFPMALGKKLPKMLARYFNNVVLLRKKGSGTNVSRELITTATLETDLKVSKPSKVPPVMEPDLGKLFKLLQTA
jgi:hypothetical protein